MQELAKLKKYKGGTRESTRNNGVGGKKPKWLTKLCTTDLFVVEHEKGGSTG